MPSKVDELNEQPDEPLDASLYDGYTVLTYCDTEERMQKAKAMLEGDDFVVAVLLKPTEGSTLPPVE